MFAVISTGGKQYKVAKNDVIMVEKLEVEAGAAVTFGEVLMVGDDGSLTVGAPLVQGASVVAEVLAQDRGRQDHHLQEEPPPELPPQDGPPSAPDRAAHHRDQRVIHALIVPSGTTLANRSSEHGT